MAPPPEDMAASRVALLRLAHVNRSAYTAARPLLYGTLSIALRNTAAHQDYELPEYRPFPEEMFKNSPELAAHVNHCHLVRRERIAAARRVFPGWCEKSSECSEMHMDRDRMIAKVTEVPEVFPFVILGGKLYLASLAANETRFGAVDEEKLVETIEKAVASLLVDGSDGDSPVTALEVKILNGLVLVQYPLHLVTALHLRTGDVDLLDWLGTDKKQNCDGPDFDWQLKLPFLLHIPPQHLETVSVSLDSHCGADQSKKFSTLCSDLLGQLLQMLPHVSTLDVTSTHPSPCPPRFAANIRSAYVFQLGHFYDIDIVPTTVDQWPSLRHLELHGNHSFCNKAWRALLNHPTLQTLVTDFELQSSASGCLPMRAPALKSWTTSIYVLGHAFDLPSPEPRWDSNDMFTALEELTLVVHEWRTEAALGRPDFHSQVPTIPFSRLGNRLRTITVATEVYDFSVWVHIPLEVLGDVLALPHLEELNLPNVLPLYNSQFPNTMICATLAKLNISIQLFVSAILPFVSLPNISSLFLVGDYIPEPQHQITPDLWLQIARFAPRVNSLALLQIPFSLTESSSFAFPPNSPPLVCLERIVLLTTIGLVDVTCLPAIAPNLIQADLDVDQIDGLPVLLAHPTVAFLRLTGVRCQSALAALLAHDHAAGPGIHRMPMFRSMYSASGETVAGEARVRGRRWSWSTPKNARARGNGWRGKCWTRCNRGA